MDIEERVFRQEAGRLVSILTRLFGIQNLALAEDVVQDAFCRALETWKFSGVPGNPQAWLVATAKNRALDALRRERNAQRFEPDLQRHIESEWTLAPTVEEAFGAGINDAQLRMMFSCAHPDLPEEAQVALILHLLCGFGIGETAAAFLATPAAMEKRLSRAKKVLAESRALVDVGRAEDVRERLPAVLRALYLLFNEGYHGASAEAAVRAELCEEALRLCYLLVEHRHTSTPAVHALAALVNLHAARLPGRVDVAGHLAVFAQQDRSLWNAERIDRGRRLLELSATGDEITPYHVEAGIAYLHASAPTFGEIDWGGIVCLYDSLMAIQPSPVVALNRAIAVAQRDGPARGLEEIAGIGERERLDGYPFYHAAIGEFEMRLGRADEARESFGKALGLARNASEKRFLLEKMVRGGALLTLGG